MAHGPMFSAQNPDITCRKIQEICKIPKNIQRIPPFYDLLSIKKAKSQGHCMVGNKNAFQTEWFTDTFWNLTDKTKEFTCIFAKSGQIFVL